MSEAARVCIIDDDGVFLKLCREVLACNGHHVETFSRADAIDWDIVAQCQFVLLDLLMEGEDGLDIIDRLEASDFKGAVHILTGLDMQGADALIAHLLGSKVLVSGIIQKPFFGDTLLAALDDALDATRVLPFSEESRSLLELAIGSERFRFRFEPVLNAEGGSIHSQVLHLDVILGWQPFHFRRLDDLIQHGGLQTPWLDWLFRLVRNASRRPESWAGKPLVLSLPARLLMDAGSFARVTAELEGLTERGVQLRPMVVEQDYLLYGAGLLQPLQALRELGYPLVLDGARHVLALEYLPALMLFDEVRLHPACRRHAARPGSTDESKILGLLHQNGLALTFRTPFAWITQRPDSEFRPGLLTGNHSLKTAIGLKKTA